MKKKSQTRVKPKKSAAKTAKSKKEKLAEVLAQFRALPVPKADLATPEGAVLSIENAYRNKDLKAVLKCKDFKIEAQMMFVDLGMEELADRKTISETAKTLEAAFRSEIVACWPDMEGMEIRCTKQTPVSDTVVVVTEIQLLANGKAASESHIRVAKTKGGWKVLNVVESPED